MIASSWRAAFSVSQSLTQNITISTGPMVRGSSVTLTLGRWSGCGPPSTARPCSRMAARCAPRATKCTSAPPLASRAPKYPPTPPEPMIAIRTAHPPATSGRSNTVPARSAQSVGGGGRPLRGRARSGALVRFASVLAGLQRSPHIGLDRPGRCNPPVGRSGAPRGPLKVAYEGFETMSRVPSLSSPFLLGFDEIERALDRVAKAADGYPPYNVERIARQNSQPERLRITLAVAGFTRDQLDVTVEESQLVIRGRQQDDKEHHYLHRGIAARQFQRTFVLADGMEVLGADLKNGLLSIDLARPEPERIVKTISITDCD